MAGIIPEPFLHGSNELHQHVLQASRSTLQCGWLGQEMRGKTGEQERIAGSRFWLCDGSRKMTIPKPRRLDASFQIRGQTTAEIVASP